MSPMRYLLLLLFLCYRPCLWSQNGIPLPWSAESPRFPEETEHDPRLLAAALIKDKLSDKDKFDAIFLWIANNVRYNYAAYYSSSGSAITKVEKILKRKRGICIDYAVLMDTL